MTVSFRCILISSLAFCCSVGQSQERDSQRWIKLSTPKCELYTDTNSTTAREILSLFETAESATLRPGDQARRETQGRLRVIAFANEAEYAPFRLNAAALGHYLHARDRDYIVLAGADPEHFQAAVHEYTHYSANRAGYHLPLWLNEGIADLYSTTATKTGHPVLGGPLSGRLSTLNAIRLLPLNDLFAVGRGLSLYTEPEKAALFYSESWALTHLLAMDGRYAGRFPELLNELSAGRSTTDVLWSIYRRTPEEFEAELPAYIRHMQEGRPVVGISEMQVEPGQATVAEFERRVLWADLLVAHPATAARAKDQLLELKKEFPEQPEPDELLGHLAWDAKHSEEAQRHWGKAIEHGSLDFETLYRHALHLHAAGGPSSVVIALMEKAVSAKPGSDEAVYNLGVLKYEEGQYEAASQTLLRLQKIAPERAYTYYSVLAYCDIKMKAFDGAKAFLLKAAESARTPEQQAENSRMLRFAAARAD
ncbi:MAG: tetratricopeptide repeat protein [Bryobacteraceae bacterium]